MTWLFEQPLMIVFLGVALILGLGAIWSASGRNEPLFGMGAVLVVLIACLVTERLIVTDGEAIRGTLSQIAREVQSNQRRAVAGHVYSGAPELKRKVEAELPKYQFTECRITKIHLIDVDSHAEPRSAIVEFNVIGSGTLTDGTIAMDHVAQWVRLHMLREKDGRWTIAEYELDAPQRMIVNQPTEK